MASPSESEVVKELLKTPSIALLRKFNSLGYSLLLRLQSELSAIEAHSGETLMERIDLRRAGATEVTLRSEVFSQDGQLEEVLLRKLMTYCKWPSYIDTMI